MLGEVAAPDTEGFLGLGKGWKPIPSAATEALEGFRQDSRFWMIVLASGRRMNSRQKTREEAGDRPSSAVRVDKHGSNDKNKQMDGKYVHAELTEFADGLDVGQ